MPRKENGRNKEKGEEEEACGWSANQTSNLVLAGRSEGEAGAHRERTRHPGFAEPEALHGRRELELRHIAWETGKEERGTR